MILPTPAEVSALRAASMKRFGPVRLLLVRLEGRIDAAIVLAALDLKSYSDHTDARQANATTAASCIVVDRMLWCSGAGATVDVEGTDLQAVALTRLEALREVWPATDGLVDVELRIAAGSDLSPNPAVRLTAGNAPHGFTIPADAKTSGPGALWLASWGSGAPAVSMVMRQPLPDVWTAGKAYWNDAIAKGAGIVSASTRFAAEHVVWSPEPLDQLLDRLPFLALNLVHPFLAMGGHGAESSGSFL